MPALNLEAERLRRGKSIPQLAEEIGIPDYVLRRAEKNGQRPHPENALKIAKFFGVDVLEQWPIREEKAA